MRFSASIIGAKSNSHYGLGSPVENGLPNLLNLVFELRQIMAVPEFRQILDGIGLGDLAHVQRVLHCLNRCCSLWVIRRAVTGYPFESGKAITTQKSAWDET